MDVIAGNSALFLGNRLKRLGEQLQAGAARVIAEAGLPLQPAHMPILLALGEGPATIGTLARRVGSSQPTVTRAMGQLTALGVVEPAPARDQRERAVRLSAAGEVMLARTRTHVAPRVIQAVEAMLAPLPPGFHDTLSAVEAALAERPLDRRVAPLEAPAVEIIPWRDDLAAVFRDINTEWIEAMFRLKDTDRDVLDHPRARIVDPGGTILFVATPELGIVGTCALQKTGDHAYELTKMGVRAAARGLKAGEALLRATIGHALTLGADPLYLLTNARAEAAVHLYEKAGFVHDAEIMARYGARYARCDVAMRYRPS